MILLIGASATGKTEVGKLLNAKFGIKKVITYTTRLKRESEKEDVDYHFISKDEFEEKTKNNFFFEWVIYNDTYYGTSYESLNKDSYLIIDSKGFEKYFGSDLKYKSFYLESSKEVRLNRMLIRGDLFESALKRLEIDDVVFNNDIRSKVDYVINTDFITLNNVADMIYNYYKKNN